MSTPATARVVGLDADEFAAMCDPGTLPAYELADGCTLRPGVDPDRVAFHLWFSARLVVNHEPDCPCSWCMEVDADRAAAALGLDPSAYWYDIPDRKRGGYRSVPWWHLPARGLPRTTPRRAAPPSGLEGLPDPTRPEFTGPRTTIPEVPDPFPTPPAPGAVVLVRVAYLFPGTWARFTSTAEDGSPLVMSGGVIAGPTVVDVGGERLLAVMVRDYRGNPDRVLYLPETAEAELVDDPANRAAEMAHAVAPGLPAHAAVVDLYRRVPATRKGQADGWVPETLRNVPADQVVAMGYGGDVRLSAVQWHPKPVPGGAL